MYNNMSGHKDELPTELYVKSVTLTVNHERHDERKLTLLVQLVCWECQQLL